MERQPLPQTEFVKRTISIGLISVALLSCNGAITIDENTIIWGDEKAKTVENIAHEKRHQLQMKTVGGAQIFWERYLTEEGFDCRSEINAGADPDKHFACYDDNWQLWSPEYIDEPFIQK